MPSRSAVSLHDVSDTATLARAFWQASRGKQSRPEVREFATDLHRSLKRMHDDILSGKAPEGRWTEFQIHDPKPRRILAPCFRDRVLHHALMIHLGPVLDRALVADTFACREGKGTLAAVLRAQQHLRRFPWYVKADVQAYFASIDHGVLLGLLERRFKDPGVLRLCLDILERTPDPPGKGLPIGALTSQHFANTYLDGLDRLLLEKVRVRGLVRYMDDLVFWSDTRVAAKGALQVHSQGQIRVPIARRPALKCRVIRTKSAGADYLVSTHDRVREADFVLVARHFSAVRLSWNDNARNVRAANRNRNDPADQDDNLGFRLARAHGWVRKPALDPIDTGTCGPCAGEKQTGPGVGVGEAEASAKPHRVLALSWRAGA